MRTTGRYFSASARRASTAPVGARLIAEGEGLAPVIAGAGEIARGENLERLGRAEIAGIFGVAHLVPHCREHGNEGCRQLAPEKERAAGGAIGPARRFDRGGDTAALTARPAGRT